MIYAISRLWSGAGEANASVTVSCPEVGRRRQGVFDSIKIYGVVGGSSSDRAEKDSESSAGSGAGAVVTSSVVLKVSIAGKVVAKSFESFAGDPTSERSKSDGGPDATKPAIALMSANLVHQRRVIAGFDTLRCAKSR